MPLGKRAVYVKGLVEEHGLRPTCDILLEALNAGELKPEDFSIRELAEEFCGPNWVRALDPRYENDHRELVESGSVDSTAFSNITGQLLINKVMAAYTHDEFIGSQLVETMPTSILDTETIPGIGEIEGNAYDIKEGQPYPRLKFGEDYIETPKTTKKGFIVEVTKEAILKDRTGLLLKRAGEVGERAAIRKETDILKVVLGLVNNYNRRGTASNTYQTASPWINKQTGNELLDWTDIDASEQLFAEMVNPYQSESNEPILFSPELILVMPAKLHTARQVLGATELRITPGAGATQMLTANSVKSYKLVSSMLAYQLLKASGVSASDAKKYWVHGTPRKAFIYREAWPITVTQAPANAPAEFERDVVAQFKVSENGSCAVVEPRHVALNTG